MDDLAQLSGLLTEAAPGAGVRELRPYADVALEAFGPDRLMFGSDWPVSTLAGDYRRMVDTTADLLGALSAGEQEAVFARTATRVYALKS